MTASSASAPRATSGSYVRGCRLHRRGIRKLARALQEPFPSTSSVKFETTRSITTYEAASIEGLADAVANSTEPGDPEVLDNLVLSINDNGSAPQGRPNRAIRITVVGGGARYYVVGDPAWVHGQSAIIRALLEESRPLKRAFWYVPRWVLALWGVSTGIWVSWMVSLVVTGGLPHGWDVLAISAAAGALAGVAAGGFVSRRVRVEIWVNRDDFPAPFWRLNAGEMVSTAIALLGLVAAIVFGVITHKDAQKDDKNDGSLKVVERANSR